MAVVSRSSTIDSVPPCEYVPTADQRIVMHGISWEAFESILNVRGDALPRVTYLEGTLELMSPSKDPGASASQRPGSGSTTPLASTC